MFDSLKKKLKGGLKKLGKEVETKDELTVQQEQELTHEPPEDIEEVIKEEPEKIEQEEEREEHFEADIPPQAEEPEVKEETLADREPPEQKPALEEKVLETEEKLEKKGFLKKLRGIPSTIREKEIAGKDIDSFIEEVEADLMSANVAVEVIEFFQQALKDELVDKTIKRGQTEEVLREAFAAALLKIVDQGHIELEQLLEKKPTTIMFLGFNGAGKTTSIAKVAHFLQALGKKVVLAAGDTFRAASIEQLDVHGGKLGAKVIKHKYGGDPAAVVFDARKHAESQGIDVVLADTAGRMHVDKNLIDELKKIVRVNKPEFKVLVIDSLTGNDAVEQAKLFHEAVGVDAVMLTKLDVNKKGGSILSVCWAIKKPILFLGTGQEYKDILKFEPQEFVKELLA